MPRTTLALELSAGNYDIGLFCNICSHPPMTITFNTPVSGVSGLVSNVPEPPSLAVIETGLVLMMMDCAADGPADVSPASTLTHPETLTVPPRTSGACGRLGR